MTDFLMTAARLREQAGVPPQTPLDLERLLPRLVEADCVRLASLGVDSLRQWLEKHHAVVPDSLVSCADRKLRGGVVASRGYGMLFADTNDSEEEIRFTFAHEAHHFLHEHFYPRLDILERFGDTLRPVLDGLRPPTQDERIHALLGRKSLLLHAHLLDRENNIAASLDAIEADADAFACEILAPRAALQAHFPTVKTEETPRVEHVLREEFRLPEFYAASYARSFVAEHAAPVGLLHRLRLI